jgi:tRNA U38,U39,U40 pseudouridine synthase TruA
MSRYIISFGTGKKLTYDGVEFLELLVEGQSFMIHQIRKMIGI